MRVWTDGACTRNPGGYGGWAFVVEVNGQVVHQAHGGQPDTTSNRMELIAVIEALNWLDGRRAQVYSDSQYVVYGATKWMPRWKQHGWRMSAGSRHAPKNSKLWKTVDRLLARSNVELAWVRGHNGERFNELADDLAQAASRKARRDDPAEDFLSRFPL